MIDGDADPPAVPLSRAGEVRRGDILALAKSETRRMRRRRTLRRALGVCAISAIAAGIFVAYPARRQSPQPTARLMVPAPAQANAGGNDTVLIAPATRNTTVATAIPPPQTIPGSPSIPLRARPRRVMEIVRIVTDPTIADRLAVPPQAATWKKIDDETLLKRLASVGKPAALAYVDGREMILYRHGTGR